TSSIYGLGWTFDFQRSSHIGSLSPGAYDLPAGILTDASGRAQVLSWDAARGQYELGGMALVPSTSQVTSASGSATVPALAPVDLLNGAATIADGYAPGGYALRLEGSSGPPPMLIMPPGVIPAQQNGTIEFWFRPNFDMSQENVCHVFFADSQLRFGLAYNCPLASYSWGSPTSKALDFFTYDTAYHTVSTPTLNPLWGTTADLASSTHGWHHISLTWADGGALQV